MMRCGVPKQHMTYIRSPCISFEELVVPFALLRLRTGGLGWCDALVVFVIRLNGVLVRGRTEESGGDLECAGRVPLTY